MFDGVYERGHIGLSAADADVTQVNVDGGGLPDGHLRAVWPDRAGNSPEGHERSHNALGSAVLAALLALTITAIRGQRHPHRGRQG